MDPLFTPWRLPYILAIKSGVECIFCDEVLAAHSQPDLILHRGVHAFVILNLYPYSVGHLMVVPYRHVGNLEDLSPEEISEVSSLLAASERALRREPGDRRHAIGVNVGRCAGAGVEGHLHVHLVPLPERQAGPMRTGPEAEELPEPLSVTRDRLAQTFHAP
jgi:ATP adenylyltransferase